MRSTTKLFALTFMFVSLATMATAGGRPCNISTPPDGAQLDKYKPQSGPLSETLWRSMGLHQMTLTKSWVGHNYYRAPPKACEAWKYETLLAGTEVLADKNNDPIYK